MVVCRNMQQLEVLLVLVPLMLVNFRLKLDNSLENGDAWVELV